MTVFTVTFWRETVERAVKTAAQFALVGLGGNFASVWSVDWKTIAGTAAAGAVTSVLTSVGSERFGPSDTPSVVYSDDLL